MRVVFVLMIAAGSVTLYLGNQQYKKIKILVERGIATKAVVIDLGKKYVELPKYSGYVYKPVLEYSDLEGNKVTSAYNTTTHSTSSLYQLGDTIEIIYYKEKPQKQRENSFQGLYLLPFSFSLGGLVFIGIGLWASIYFWRNKNRLL